MSWRSTRFVCPWPILFLSTLSLCLFVSSLWPCLAPFSTGYQYSNLKGFPIADWKKVLRLWETIWSRHRSHSISLFIALAVIEVHGLPLIAQQNTSDQVLEFFNSLAMNMDVNTILRTTRAVRVSTKVAFAVRTAC